MKAYKTAVLCLIVATILFSCKKEEDKDSPSLTLKGELEMDISLNEEFDDPGYTAIDDMDGNITSQVVVTTDLDINQVGTYEVHYDVADAAGNTRSAVRIVNVFNNAWTLAGTYSVSYNCSDGSGPFGPYMAVITMSETQNLTFTISPMFIEFDSNGEEVFGDVQCRRSGSTLFIDPQNVGGIMFEGAGQLNDLGFLIDAESPNWNCYQTFLAQ